VMDDARAEVARRILGEASTTIKEAGFRMGFSDVSAFHRAFKRWTGLTPAEFRRGLGEGGLDEESDSNEGIETVGPSVSVARDDDREVDVRALAPVRLAYSR